MPSSPGFQVFYFFLPFPHRAAPGLHPFIRLSARCPAMSTQSPQSSSPSSPASSPSSSPPPSPRRRPVRSTRGVRVSDLHGEGLDEFWDQDFFADANNDSDYSGEEEVPVDEVDSDFFLSENDDEGEEGEAAEPKEEKTKKKAAYKDPGIGGRAVNKPTTVSASVSSRYPPMTQAARLLEAEATERANRISLDNLLRQEEDKKQIATHVSKFDGPTIIFRSKSQPKGSSTGRNSLLFTGVFDLPSLFPSSVRDRRSATCALTKAKARYQCMVNGELIPVADMATYQALQTRVLNGEGPAIALEASKKRRREGRELAEERKTTEKKNASKNNNANDSAADSRRAAPKRSPSPSPSPSADDDKKAASKGAPTTPGGGAKRGRKNENNKTNTDKKNKK